MNFKLSSSIVQKFKAAHAGVVYLFGSQAQKTTSFGSDLDIGIVLIHPLTLFQPKKFHSLYEKFYKLFLEILPKNFKGKLDLVFLQATSYSLQFEAVNYGKVLYEISPDFRADYEEKVLKNYLALKPLLEEFHQATLTRAK